jgi:hypothetical protein
LDGEQRNIACTALRAGEMTLGSGVANAAGQKRWMMPTPAANMLREDDGALWKPSPIVALAAV